MSSSKLTALPAIEQMITDMAVVVKTIFPTMDKKYSPERLEELLRRGLREGVLTLTIKAVEAAEKNEDEIADAALRQVGAEMMGGRIVEGEGGVQIWAYYQRAGLRSPLTRPRGKRWYNTYIRDLEICFLIVLASTLFGLSPTRNREARRADRNPSGISLITAALARNGLHLEEDTVQRDIWHGVRGELARLAIARGPAWAPRAELVRMISKTPICDI
jgi:hypothetical protein